MTEQSSYIEPQSNPEDEEIDVLEILVKLWKNRKTIGKWCAIGAVIGLVIGFSVPKTWEAKVSFAPEIEQKLGSGLSSVASMMGVSLDNSVDAISVEMFPDVIASTPFIFELFDLQVETKDGKLKTDLLDYMKNHQKRPWWSHVIGAPFKALAWVLGADEEPVPDTLDVNMLPKREREIVRYFADNIKIVQSKKTGKTDISIRMQDPQVAATVLEAVVENLKDYMSDYRTSKERQTVENLEEICKQRKDDFYKAQKAYADYLDANKNLSANVAMAERQRVQQEMQLAYQVYSQVATQLEGARIKEQQAKPVFVVLEPVTVPLRKAAPSKSMLLIGFAFIAACLAACWILFGKDYWTKMKTSV